MTRQRAVEPRRPAVGLATPGRPYPLGCRLRHDGASLSVMSSRAQRVELVNLAVVRRLIRDSLDYWVRVMHVDGFRFDLASIFSRDPDGKPVAHAPLVWDIDTDPVLAGTKLIAEAWDPGGLYQVGSFAGNYWKEWNGKFRDDVRAFVRGDEGRVGSVVDRLIGSPAVYGGSAREAEQSINFFTAHDGVTLNELVSYRRKHNLANGEHNADGTDHNLSCNYGVEGPTDDPHVLRAQHVQGAAGVRAAAAPRESVAARDGHRARRARRHRRRRSGRPTGGGRPLRARPAVHARARRAREPLTGGAGPKARPASDTRTRSCRRARR
jgi:pullulanase/glycogen debranching enzyme